MITLTDRCEEGTTYAIKGIAFTDEDGTAVLPNSDPTWCLCNEAGTELDSGTLTAGLSMDLVLSGEQTTITADELSKAKYQQIYGKRVYQVVRTVTIRGVINSTLGSDLPVTQEFFFLIENLDCIG